MLTALSLRESAVSRRHILWTLIAVLGVFVAEVVSAGGQKSTVDPKRPPQGVECTKLTGTIMAAPSWKSVPDGTGTQVLRLEYMGQKGKVTWLLDGKAYYEAQGVTIELRTGFVILVPAEEYVETYVYNPGSAEVLFASTRSGSQLLPNSIKAFRGTCTLGFGGKSPGE